MANWSWDPLLKVHPFGLSFAAPDRLKSLAGHRREWR